MIAGSLRDAPVADVFQVIVAGHKSGVLTVIRNEVKARLYFELGRIQYAHLAPGVHLGEVLVRLELLSSYEVQKILHSQNAENAGTPLGLMAVAAGILSESDLRRALETQVTEVVSELVGWRSGSFTFAERSLMASQVPTEHTLDAVLLLLSVAQRLESYRQGSAPSSARFARAADPTTLNLPAGGWEVLGYVDGRRSAQSIAAELDLSERQVYRILFELEQQGAIYPLPFTIDDPLVLVICASSALQRLIRLALQRARLRADVVATPEAALRRLQESYPQAIVIDDDGDATEFLKALRKLPQGHLPVLVLGDTPHAGVLGRLRRSRARRLQKPFHEIDFQQTVTQMVGCALL